MSSEAKKIQSNTAKQLIVNYVQDLTEQDALEVFHTLLGRFDWSGTVFTKGDIITSITEYHEVTDDSRHDEIINKVIRSWEWKHLDDTMAESGFELIHNAVHEALTGEVLL